MRGLLFPLVLALSFCACGPGQNESSAPLEEASMNFDLEDVEPFLVAVARRIDTGFSVEEAGRLATEIAALPVEGQTAHRYSVSFAGRDMELRIEAFMDDIEAPDLYLFAPAALARAIDEEMSVYFQ